LLTPCGALKGNTYFRRHLSLKDLQAEKTLSDSEAATGVHSLISKAIAADNQAQNDLKPADAKDVEEDEDFFSKLKQQAPRYFL